MPLYEYHCEQCGYRFETLQRFSDPPLTDCEKCGNGTLKKLISAPAVQFKGTGWYVTDYAGKKSGGDKSAKGSAKSSGGDSSKSSGSGDAGASSSSSAGSSGGD
ncbi:MAG: FmdB family zinc ribbon protein [Acidobacteriota bacterium]